MPYKNNIKQRNKTVQGLRSFKDTLPTNIKKIISRKGHIFSETLNKWKYIAGEELFRICYPKSYKNSSKFRASTLVVMVTRGQEVNVEYSKKQIIDKMNSYFGYKVIEKLKLISFDPDQIIDKKTNLKNKNDMLNKDFKKKIINIKNDKIKKSLIELNKLFIKK